MKKKSIIFLVGILFTMTSCQKEPMVASPELINQQSPEEPNIPPTNNILAQYPSTIKTITTTNPPSDLTLLQYLKGETEYNIFYQAMYRTGVDLDISGDGPFTIFVPSNEVFQTFLDDNNWTSLDDISQNVLTTMVKFHISNVEVKITELEIGMVVPLFLTGKEMYINMDDPINPFLTLGSTNAGFIEKDLEHTNGIIHKINGVLSL
jgi:uncharacterized surface protein with fasciclin (FAS1) repeats